MKSSTLLDKVWGQHVVRPIGAATQLLIDVHLIHEVTSPQAFGMLRELGLKVRFPGRTFATVDHIVPTAPGDRFKVWQDPEAQIMLEHLRRNCAEFGIRLFDVGDPNQGIVHVVGPQLGLTRPGSTIACGDSHTATHGAFGAIAFGIGTTQVRDVLASQTVLMTKPKCYRIEVQGRLGTGVTAKDLTLFLIGKLGVSGGQGYAYEYAGDAVSALSLDGRMTLCNMAIEGGARFGYVNPDDKTVEFLKGRPFSGWPEDAEGQDALRAKWLSWASDRHANYDNRIRFEGESVPPMVTWGVNPGQVIGVTETIPEPSGTAKEAAEVREALEYMKLKAGAPILGTPIDVAFVGSCTNGRLSDLREAASLIEANRLRVAPGVQAIVVPGSDQVRRDAEALGLHRVFTGAGFEWREAGCSMCLAMNPDKLVGDQLCASSSNRNFKGRQGSKTGRTLLMSPAMVVASAAAGMVADPRSLRAA
jgi:3-isopropylmalate/(R)-2-methylmalate dehydratase large subunit